MKKKITLILLLVSLFTTTISVKPVFAEDFNDDEIVETVNVEDDSSDIDVEGEDIQPVDVEEADINIDENNIDDIVIEDEDDDEIVDVVTNDSIFVAPDGFVLSKQDLQFKKTAIKEGVLEKIETLEEGKDYAEKELMFFADNLEYVEMVAQVYFCDVVSFADNIAVIRINNDDVSVKDAVLASLDLSLNLPLVEPNYIVAQEPVIIGSEELQGDSLNNEQLPEPKQWYDWVNDVFDNVDPYIASPTSDSFQWQHDMINTFTGWNATLGSRNIKVAVIDESINPNHVDLAGKVSIEKLPYVSDCYDTGHGQHVAGIIAASVNNGTGGAGVAPNVSIIGINVFNNSDVAESSDIAAAVNRAVSRGADVINMSLGSYFYNSSIDAAVQNAIKSGVTVVAAAGNDGGPVKNYPACLNGVIAVGAVSRNGLRADYSNYGSWVTISAPGTDIRSTISTSENDNYSYGLKSGTSMATPVVTGAIALYMSKFGRVSPSEIKKILRTSVSACGSSQMGYGIIDLEKMFAKSNDVPVFKINNAQEGTDRYKELIKNPLPLGSYIELSNSFSGNDDMILYSFNGKKPTVKDGEIINGTVYTSGRRIYVSEFAKGTNVTIYAANVNSFGVMGKVKSITFKTPAVNSTTAAKVKTVTLNNNKLTISYPFLSGETNRLQVTSLINTLNQSISLYSVDYKWTSSDTSVVTVDQSGYITPKKAGTAKITLHILDGSKKTAVCNVTVNQLVESLKIDGFTSMSPGSSTTFKANVSPANAKNKNVTWEIINNSAGATIDKNGKVTVPKDAQINTYFGIRATTLDGSNRSATKYVFVRQKATAVSINVYNYPEATYNKNNVLTSVSLFTHDDLGNQCLKKKSIKLNSYVTGGSNSVVWSTNNPKVATVDNYGNVTAVSAGKAVITCTVNDGSNKKASVNVLVQVPVSSLSLDLGKYTSVCEGKNLKLNDKVSYGALYGKPTSKKVDWNIDLLQYYDGYDLHTIYDSTIISKCVTINNGTLSVKANGLSKLDPYAESATVRITARTTDGTNFTSTTYVAINKPIKILGFDYPQWNCYSRGEYAIDFYCDQPVQFEAKSSNMKNVAVTGVYSYNQQVWYNGKYCYKYQIVFVAYPVWGSANITVKALDGSNKTASTKINLR